VENIPSSKLSSPVQTVLEVIFLNRILALAQMWGTGQNNIMVVSPQKWHVVVL
jgi:hypothetical protein